MFLKERGEQRGATRELLAEEKEEIFIVFVQRATWEFDVPLT